MTGRGLVLAGTYQAPWQLAAPWGARGYISALDGPVHWIEFGGQTAGPVHGIELGGQTSGPPIVFVHGLGGSHLNWALVGPQLSAGRRAVALDLHGFGLTPGTGRTATITANLALLNQFIAEIAGQPAILVGNSMGGMLAILQAHAHPESVAGLVLIAPALPARLRAPDLSVAGQLLAYAIPGLGEAYLRAQHSRVPPRQLVQRVIDLCFADPARADPAMVEASVALAELRQGVPGTSESLLAAARSLLKVAGQPRRYWAMMAALCMPVLLLGGTADRLVPAPGIRAAAARNPGWQTEIMGGVGHTPQLETPHAVLLVVQDWLDRHFPSSLAQE
jgi:pimeloyl-ACP methyl ester carboxylesterase